MKKTTYCIGFTIRLIIKAMDNTKCSFPRIERIRKLAFKNYIDIKYKPDPSPALNKNSLIGHNLIKHSETTKNLKNRRNPGKSDRLETQKSKNEVNPILIQLDIKELNPHYNSKLISAMKSKLIERRYFSNIKQKYFHSEIKSINYGSNLAYVIEDLNSQKKIGLKIKQLPNRRTKSIENLITERHGLVGASDFKVLRNISPIKEYKFST